MGRLQDIYVQRMVNYLAKEGARIVYVALATKSSFNDTYNQADAYGYIVFYNGVVKKKGYATTTPLSKGVHKGWEREGIPDGTGREWLDEFISTYDPPKSGFALLIVNAAFYSSIQEGGKWNILSQVVTDIKELQANLKGSTITPIGNITIT